MVQLIGLTDGAFHYIFESRVSLNGLGPVFNMIQYSFLEEYFNLFNLVGDAGFGGAVVKRISEGQE